MRLPCPSTTLPTDGNAQGSTTSAVPPCFRLDTELNGSHRERQGLAIELVVIGFVASGCAGCFQRIAERFAADHVGKTLDCRRQLRRCAVRGGDMIVHVEIS